MSDKVQAQNIFINQLRVKKAKVNVFLANKTRLHGVIAGFDDYTIVLESEGKQTLVYKNQISSITPISSFKPINIEHK